LKDISIINAFYTSQITYERKREKVFGHIIGLNKGCSKGTLEEK